MKMLHLKMNFSARWDHMDTFGDGSKAAVIAKSAMLLSFSGVQQSTLQTNVFFTWYNVQGNFHAHHNFILVSTGVRSCPHSFIRQRQLCLCCNMLSHQFRVVAVLFALFMSSMKVK